MKTSKKRNYSFRHKMNIGQIITVVFLGVILVGAILLCLPFSSRSGESCGPLVAIFTSTSATCVTGLSLVDTWSQWSLFGQVVILLLIQVGGLGFMSIASLLFFAIRRKFDLGQLFVMAQSMGTENIQDVIRIQKKILIGGLSIEGIGCAVLSLRFMNWYSAPKAVWLGLFHSVSAFCNAGFDVLGFEEPGSSLMLFNTDTVICVTIALLIIVGGIGFVVWDDISSLKRPRNYNVYTKLVLIVTAVLVVLGTAIYLLLEYNNPATLGDMSPGKKVLVAFFQSVTTRTAGFASIDQGALTETGKIFTILLMFVGGASGSTAGGLKVVTMLVIVLFLSSRMLGRDKVHIHYRRIPDRQIMDALSLFGMMALFSILGATIICGTTDYRLIDGLYESVSALATVGLSTGITANLSLVGKILMIIYMFFGRIGILTISMGFLQTKKKHEDFSYPDIIIPIG